MSYKGKYRVKNYRKYKGDPTSVVYRSLWEKKFMDYCDKNPNVVEWSSEEIVIPYKDPVQKKIRRYFPDFYMNVKQADGNIKKFIKIKRGRIVTKLEFNVIGFSPNLFSGRVMFSITKRS